MRVRPVEAEIVRDRLPDEAFAMFERQRERARPRVQTIDVRPRRQSGWGPLGRLVRALDPRR